MRVVEIFCSIDGEGRTAGYPAVFVRLEGCNLTCLYCDTPYAHEGVMQDKVRNMTPQAILDEVRSYGIERVTITGGEPLIHPEIEFLIELLLRHNYWVNVETNGTRIPPRGGYRSFALCITMDYKTASCGHTYIERVNSKALSVLRKKDVLKFVIGSVDDLDEMVYVLQVYKAEWGNDEPMIFVSPIWGQIEPKSIVEYIVAHKLNNVRIQLQMHKIIWPAEMRGV